MSNDSDDSAAVTDDGAGDCYRALLGYQEDSRFERLEHFAFADVYERNLVGKVMLETIRDIAGNPHDLSLFISVLHRMSNHQEAIIRAELMDHIPHIAMLCHANKGTLLYVVDNLLSLVAKSLTDIDNKVRKSAQVTLLVLMDQALLQQSAVEDVICPVVIQQPTLEDYPGSGVQLMSKMAPFLGPDATKRLFLKRFCDLCRDTVSSVRKRCVLNFGEFCAVVGQRTTEEVLLPRFVDLCQDEAWPIRKSCADVLPSVSYVCSIGCRKGALAPLFINLLRDSARPVRTSAFRTLGPFISTFAVPNVADLTYDENGELVFSHPKGTEFRFHTGLEKSAFDKQVNNISIPVQERPLAKFFESLRSQDKSDNFSEHSDEQMDSMAVDSSNLVCDNQEDEHNEDKDCSENELNLSTEDSAFEEHIDSSLTVREEQVANFYKSVKEKSKHVKETHQMDSMPMLSDLMGESKGDQFSSGEESSESVCHIGQDDVGFLEEDNSVSLLKGETSIAKNVDLTSQDLSNKLEKQTDLEYQEIQTLSDTNVCMNRSLTSMTDSNIKFATSLEDHCNEIEQHNQCDELSASDEHIFTSKGINAHELSQNFIDLSDICNEFNSVMDNENRTFNCYTSSSGDKKTSERDSPEGSQVENQGKSEVMYSSTLSQVDPEEEADYNSFQYWRIPVPEVNVESLEDDLKKVDLGISHNKLTQYCSGLNFCIGDQYDKLNINVSSMPLCLSLLSGPPQDIVPQELVELFVSMTGPAHYNSEIAQHCAFSLPAVALTLGPKNWGFLRGTYEALANDMQWTVRRAVASSIHALAEILGEELATQDLVPIFCGLIKDLDEVRIGALRHLAEFLKLLPSGERDSFLPKLGEFLVTDNESNWRFREELAQQLFGALPLFSPGDACAHIKPIAISLLRDKVAAVRSASLHLVTQLITHVRSEPTLLRQLLPQLAEEFAHSLKWERRQAFALLCSHLVSDHVLAGEQFAREVLPHLLDLSYDSVPNVRLAVARTLASGVLRQNFLSDQPHLDVLMQVLRRLSNDNDRDVRYFAAPRSF